MMGPGTECSILSQHPREERKDIACYLGDPDVSFVGIAESFGIKGEMVASPDQIKPAMKRAVRATKEGRPYLIDAVITQMGAGAGGNWHPEISIAAGRKRKV